MGTHNPARIDALDLLVTQHDTVLRLLDETETEALIERKQFLFDELADKLIAHALMEEKLFYPAVRAVQTQEIIALEDHAGIKQVLADLLVTDVDDVRFDAKLAVLREEILQHAREDEEQVLLPKLRRLMTEEQRFALGFEMAALFVRLMDARPRALFTPSVEKILDGDLPAVRARRAALE